MEKLTIERREYEDKSIHYLRRALPKHRRVLAVGPTGSGKTVIAAQLIARDGGKRWPRVLFLAHRYELVDQAYRTLDALGVHAGICMATEENMHGDERVRPHARVQVGSVQTAEKRGVPGDFDLIIFDEAHHTMANSYLRIAAAQPNACVLGLTATPCRLDGKGLGDFYQKLHIIAPPSALYAKGYLAKPRVYSAPPDVLATLTRNLKGVRSAYGDYAPKHLARAVDKKFLIGRVVEEALRLAPHVPKVIFACDVLHSKHIARSFRRAGVTALHIDANTPPEKREAALRKLREGALEVICNVDILGEGWDLPALGAVGVARPTKSLARFLQFCGRVMRPYEGRVPIIIDHGANVQRLDVLPGQDITWSLTDGVDPTGPGRAPTKVCFECYSHIPIAALSCPHCGIVQPHDPPTLRQEIKVDLEEITAARMAKMRAGVEALAAKKNAPPGWVDKVMDRYAR